MTSWLSPPLPFDVPATDPRSSVRGNRAVEIDLLSRAPFFLTDYIEPQQAYENLGRSPPAGTAMESAIGAVSDVLEGLERVRVRVTEGITDRDT